MTENEIRKVVAEAVAETLTRMGIQANDPLEVQKDMQHLRSWRTSTEAVKRQSILTAIGVITLAVGGLIWAAIKGTG